MSLLYKLAASRQDKEIQRLMETDPHKAIALMEQIYKKTGIRDNDLDALFGRKHLVTKDIYGYAKDVHNKLNDTMYRGRIKRRTNNYLSSGTGKKFNVKKRLKYVKNDAAEIKKVWSYMSPEEKKKLLHNTMRQRMGLHRLSYIPEETYKTLQKKYKTFPDNELIEQSKAKKLLNRKLTKKESKRGVLGKTLNNEVIWPQRRAIEKHIPDAFKPKTVLNITKPKEEKVSTKTLPKQIDTNISTAALGIKPKNSILNNSDKHTGNIGGVKIVSNTSNYIPADTSIKNREFTPEEIAKLEKETIHAQDMAAIKGILGVGALGALGYGVYKYKHRNDDDNPYSQERK